LFIAFLLVAIVALALTLVVMWFLRFVGSQN